MKLRRLRRWIGRTSDGDHGQLTLGPFHIAEFDFIGVRVAVEPESDGSYLSQELTIGVMCGDSQAVGSGISPEPKFDLNGFAINAAFTNRYAQTARTGFMIQTRDNVPQAAPHELRWAAAIDQPFALVGIAGPLAAAALPVLLVEIVAGIGAVHAQPGDLNVLEWGNTVAGPSSEVLPLVPHGGPVRWYIYTTDTDIRILLAGSDGSLRELRKAADPAGTTEGELTLAWVQYSIVTDAGAGFNGVYFVIVTARPR